ncbi:MAG: YibE/F family protein [Minisyncoccia bacterium]
MQKLFFSFFLLVALFFPQASWAQETVATEILEKAQVLEVSNVRTEIPAGTTAASTIQTLKVRVLEGEEQGSVFTFENDFTQLSVGDVFYLRHTFTETGIELYAVADPYRLPVLLGLTGIFVVLVFLFGGLQGIRGLASLAGSFILIFYLLLPGIVAGYSPVLVSIGVASLIIIVGSYITHGYNRTTTAAVFGMIVTVVISGVAAYIAVHAADLSGYNSENSTYLHFNSGGTINILGVLMGGILIGLLGVLYDVAIGQAVSVEELMSAGKHLSKGQIYRKAIRIGREHIGALVNTLAIAYVGAALPLLLLFHMSSGVSVGYIINGEIFATEIIRILIGSIGLILAVPITTFIAVTLLGNVREKGV